MFKGAIILFLLSVFRYSTADPIAQGETDGSQAKTILRAFRSPILVKASQSVAITSQNFQFQMGITEAGKCRVELDENEPLSGMVGFLEPKKFDCMFANGSVRYHHEGSPLSSRDSLRLMIYYFRHQYKYHESVTLQVKVNLEAPSVLLQTKLNLIVPSTKGISNPINAQTIQFRYNPSIGEKCSISYDSQRRLKSDERGPWLATKRWPMLGQLVIYNKTIIREFKHDCQQFLLMGYRYKHLRHTSPNYDFIPVHIRVVNASGYPIGEERHYIKVEMTNSEPSKIPLPVILRPLNLTNYGGTVSLIPKDSLTVTNYELGDRFLTVIIDSIQTDIERITARFVNLRDATRSVTSFTVDDLREGLVGFQLSKYNKRLHKTFVVALRLMDPYCVTSRRVNMTIVTVLAESKRSEFQLFWNPLMVYTGSTQLIGVHNIQTVGTLDPDFPVRYELLPYSELHKSIGTHGDVFVGETPLSERQTSISKHMMYKSMVSYRHYGSLDDTDTIKVLGKYNRTITLFSLHIHVVRMYDEAAFTVLKPNFTATVNLREEICFSAEQLILPSVYQLLLRDYVDIDFAVYTAPSQGFLMRGPKSVVIASRLNGTPRPPPITKVTLRDLQNELLCYVSTKRDTTLDSFSLKQIGKNHFLPINISLYLHPIVDNVLVPKNQPNSVLRINETEAKATLTNQFLQYHSFAVEPKDIRYTIVSFPRFSTSDTDYLTEDAGRLISLSSLEVKGYEGDTELSTRIVDFKAAEINTIESFTQAQINAGDIAYVPPLGDVGVDDREVIFVYSVSDQIGGRFTNQTFQLVVLAVDNQTPGINPNETISVPRDGEIVLTQDMLGFYDQDTQENKLLLEIVLAPKMGSLMNQGKPLVKGEKIRAANVLAGKITYKNNGRNVQLDRFNLTVSDGVRTSPPHLFYVVITKRVLEASQWKLLVNNSVLVQENSTVVLHRSIFTHLLPPVTVPTSIPGFPSLFEPVQHEFFMVASPTKGTLYRVASPSSPLDSFTLDDVTNGRIAYKHTPYEVGPKQRLDLAKLWTSSLGFFSVNFTIVPVNSQRPVLQSGNMLQLREGGSAIVSPFTVSVFDPDTDINHIRIDIVRQPLWGHIQVNGAAATPTHFTIPQLQAGQVVYTNSRNSQGNEQTSDVFMIKAFDGNFYSDVTDVRIGIHPVNDERPILRLKDFTINAGLQKVLTPDYLRVEDRDMPQDVLQIRVTGLPRLGYLYIRWKHGEMQAIDSNSAPITKHYLTMLDLVYSQNVTIATSSARDSFNVSVNDGVDAHQVVGTCNIRIIGINKHRPIVSTQTLILDDESESVAVTTRHLNVSDLDTGDDDLLVTVEIPATYGQLERVQPQVLLQAEVLRGRPLGRGSTFTVEQLKLGEITYRFTALTRTDLRDTVVLFLFDGKFNITRINLAIDIKKLKPRAAPVKFSTSPLSVELGGRVVVTTDNLIVKNVKPALLPSVQFELRYHMLCGSFIRASQPTVTISSFSYLEVQNRGIIFVAVGCPEALTYVTPRITLINPNPNPGSLLQTPLEDLLRIILRPKPKQMPTVLRCRQLDALEGTETTLSSDTLYATDPDSTPDQIVYSILNGSLAIGLVKRAGLVVTEFTQEDVNNRRVTFSSPPNEVLPGAVALDKMDVLFMTITDGYHEHYVRRGLRTNDPLVINVVIKPIREINLKMVSPSSAAIQRIGKFYGFNLTGENLHVSYPDSIYTVTNPPQLGFLYNARTRSEVRKFTQLDINQGRLSYLLSATKMSQQQSDRFQFVVEVPRINASSINMTNHQMFNLTWSSLGFSDRRFKLCPRPGLLRIPVVREGDQTIKSEIQVLLQSKEARAGIDFDLYSSKIITFIPGEVTKNVSINIKVSARDVTEVMRFFVSLHSPIGAIEGAIHNVTVSIKSYRNCNDASFFTEEKVKEFVPKIDISDFIVPESMTNRSMDGAMIAAQPIAADEKPREPKKVPEHQRQLMDLPSSEELNRRYREFLEHKRKIEDEAMKHVYCEKGWRLFEKRCYRLYNKRQTWEKAQSLCKQEKSFLATIGSKEMIEWVKTSFRVRSGVWIGFHIKDRFSKWSWETGESVHFTFWKPGFPYMRGHRLKRRCALSDRNFQWRNRSCSGRRAAFLCMKNPLVGKQTKTLRQPKYII